MVTRQRHNKNKSSFRTCWFLIFAKQWIPSTCNGMCTQKCKEIKWARCRNDCCQEGFLFCPFHFSLGSPTPTGCCAWSCSHRFRSAALVVEVVACARLGQPQGIGDQSGCFRYPTTMEIQSGTPWLSMDLWILKDKSYLPQSIVLHSSVLCSSPTYVLKRYHSVNYGHGRRSEFSVQQIIQSYKCSHV